MQVLGLQAGHRNQGHTTFTGKKVIGFVGEEECNELGVIHNEIKYFTFIGGKAC